MCRFKGSDILAALIGFVNIYRQYIKYQYMITSTYVVMKIAR